ncbi:hypothetical protein LJC33_00025 [Eubacteriales bacterium OttesenSCG-928-N13]|nr:hypothetical protein [Eubacteriales bacterium OttesenSCG-928-N13]
MKQNNKITSAKPEYEVYELNECGKIKGMRVETKKHIRNFSTISSINIGQVLRDQLAGLGITELSCTNRNAHLNGGAILRHIPKEYTVQYLIAPWVMALNIRSSRP